MEKYYIYLKRLSRLRITEDDIKDYLQECKEENCTPEISDFIDTYLARWDHFDTLFESVEDTEILDSSDFDKLIKEYGNNS